MALNLLDRVKPLRLLRSCGALLVTMGYDGSLEGGEDAPGDKGIDGITKEDRLGLKVISPEISLIFPAATSVERGGTTPERTRTDAFEELQRGPRVRASRRKALRGNCYADCVGARPVSDCAGSPAPWRARALNSYTF